MERLAGKRDGKIERNGMGIGLLITFVVGACFGYIMCAVLSANTTDEEWRDLLDEVADRIREECTDKQIDKVERTCKIISESSDEVLTESQSE